jgi:carboxypeptidase Q
MVSTRCTGRGAGLRQSGVDRRRGRAVLAAAFLVVAAAACAGAPSEKRTSPAVAAAPGPAPGVAAPASSAQAAVGSASAASGADNALPPEIAAAVAKIVGAMQSSDAAHRRLVELCDGIGHRLSGSVQLTMAVQWALAALRADGHEGVRAEEVLVPRWVRGDESATIVEPLAGGVEVPMAMLGLGGSVGTPRGGITAPVLVVADEAELARDAARAKGAIVLFNNPMPAWTKAEGSGYGHCVRFRVHGARLAAAHGALAVLVRSVTARSLRSPHTGAMHYADAAVRIPAAAVSTEDAARIARLVADGQPVRVRLQMAAREEKAAPSANVVAELRGRERPEEVVILSGHLDSWDVGQGAHDDGAGVVMAMEALASLRRLGLRPRRTLRVVLWTNEENGMAGAKAYVARHAAALGDHVAAVEADAGGFAPVAFGVFSADKALQARIAGRLQGLVALLGALGTIAIEPGRSAPDVSRFHDHGVPAFGLYTHGERYFDYHHSHADTVDKVDPGELARSAAALAALGYVLAELPERIDERAGSVGR